MEKAKTLQAFAMGHIGAVEFMQEPLPNHGPHDTVTKATTALWCTSGIHTVKSTAGERTGGAISDATYP